MLRSTDLCLQAESMEVATVIAWSENLRDSNHFLRDLSSIEEITVAAVMRVLAYLATKVQWMFAVGTTSRWVMKMVEYSV